MRTVPLSKPLVGFVRALLADPSWLATGDAVLARARVRGACAAADAAFGNGLVVEAHLELESADFDRLLAVANAPRGGYLPEAADVAAQGLRSLRSAPEQ